MSSASWARVLRGGRQSQRWTPCLVPLHSWYTGGLSPSPVLGPSAGAAMQHRPGTISHTAACKHARPTAHSSSARPENCAKKQTNTGRLINTSRLAPPPPRSGDSSRHLRQQPGTAQLPASHPALHERRAADSDEIRSRRKQTQEKGPDSEKRSRLRRRVSPGFPPRC